MCEIINNEYRKYMMKDMREISNFPYTDDPSVDICTMDIPVRVD